VHPRHSDLIACPDCDLLQRSAPRSTTSARCARCGATLYRLVPHAHEMTLALMVAAAALFAMACSFPLMTLELHGRETAATVTGLAAAFHREGMSSIGLLVFVTLVLMPGIEIAVRLYQLVPLRLGFVPPALGPVSRLRRAVKPWSMIEVFVLAALVSIGRLDKIADLDLFPAFWALAAMMFLIAIADTIFDERTYWSYVAARAA